MVNAPVDVELAAAAAARSGASRKGKGRVMHHSCIASSSQPDSLNCIRPQSSESSRVESPCTGSLSEMSAGRSVHD